MTRLKSTILIVLVTLTRTVGLASVKLPNFYTDSMVVQRNAVLEITGTARNGATVTITSTWSQESVRAKADKHGRFTAKLATPEAGGPHSIIFNDGSELTLNDVMVGDVWLCSGQSNMEMPLVGWGTMDSNREIAEANYPNLRLLYIKRDVSLTPREDARLEFSGWRTANPESVKMFSAIGYFFGREINQESGIPIGVIDCSWGGTPIESWMSREAIANTGEMTDFLAVMPQEAGALPDWDNCPRWIREQRSINSYPSVLYNAMVHPLQAMAIKGVVWYQGCSNVGRAEQYSRLFKSMIESWRQGWNQDEMPFYFVQIASYLQPKWLQPDSEWAKIRQAQADALCLPKTGMAVAIDLGNPDDIHPKNKQAVAHRLAALALHNDYGMRRPCVAPGVTKAEVNGKYIVLRFDHEVALFGGGQGFIAKDARGNWHVAYGHQIAPDAIEVLSDEIDTPTEVRYGWADYPECTLRGTNGLPVAPFRVDNLKSN